MDLVSTWTQRINSVDEIEKSYELIIHFMNGEIIAINILTLPSVSFILLVLVLCL